MTRRDKPETSVTEHVESALGDRALGLTPMILIAKAFKVNGIAALTLSDVRIPRGLVGDTTSASYVAMSFEQAQLKYP